MRASIVIGLAVVLGACASIVGLDHADPTAAGDDDDSTGTSGTSNASGSSNGSTGQSSTSSGQSTTSSSSTSSGAVDSGPDVKEPPPNDGPCIGADNHCANPEQKCGEDFLCRNSCKGVGSGCEMDNGECCATFYCTPGIPSITSKCQKCIEPGKKADTLGPIPYDHSCCSGKASLIDGKCN